LIAAADVLLDPLHFAGSNTSYDGLSLAKPIVTLPTRFERSRYTLGCYQKMSFSDCVANDPRQYVEIALALGTDREFCSAITTKIRAANPVLFEDVQAVREHERIFSELVDASRSVARTSR
jgi:protein O-GlcNAc transferase